MLLARRMFVLMCLYLPVAMSAFGEEPLTLELPVPYQVNQRIGVAPGSGYAHVVVRGTLPPEAQHAEWEYCVVPLASDAQPVRVWTRFPVTIAGTHVESTVCVAAGGWYRLEVRCRENEKILAVGGVEPIGVGEVFLVAGQSYATNCNDERLNVTDQQSRVVAFNFADNSWRVAHDPQPVPDGSDGGSIWPPLGDALASELGVPIGFANVAVGATSSIQWMPAGSLYPRLVQAGKVLGRFRAVLWQQGESDVIAKTSLETYVNNLTTVRTAAAKAWGFEPPWLLAKSTHHPTVYEDEEGENRIRGAVDELLKRPGFKPGPDTDTLRDESRGDANSRRHFSATGQRCAADLWRMSVRREVLPDLSADDLLRVGLAEADITPPAGFPMAGYYHERLADGTIDPLRAKAIVMHGSGESAALVVCDIIGIATDLSREVRRSAAETTGIPAANIVIAATHTHTAPDYMKELWLKLGKQPQDPLRGAYIDALIGGLVDVIENAAAAAQPAALESGSATQQTPVSFNRRFVMRDGSVKTWQSLDNAEVVRAAGPIDPEIGLLAIRDNVGKPRGVLSNFALHLDTVGGLKWSADYPFFIAQSLQRSVGADVISVFGNGCCGDINHVNPRGPNQNTTDFIGGSLGATIGEQLGRLPPVERPDLVVKSSVVNLPLQDATEEEVARSIQVLNAAKRKENVDFFEHVIAYKKLLLDQLRHGEPYANTAEHVTWGLSRSLAGVGETLPVDVTVITLGHDVAIVCLPGEVFVDLGLAIKQGSPFRTTLVIELCNTVETVYIPHRAAYAGGSYEVTNSLLEPGSGEMLVEAALSLLREASAAMSITAGDGT